MTKEDIVWIVIKTIGICLLVLALMTLPRLVNSIYTSYKLYGQISNEYNYLERVGVKSDSFMSMMSHPMFNSFKGILIEDIIKIQLYFIVGLYMTCGGRFLFRIASAPIQRRIYLGETQEPIEEEPRHKEW